MSTFNQVNAQIGRYRWTICALVFFATTINYLDRGVLGLLYPTLRADGVFGPDAAIQELYYSRVVMAFQVAYAIGMLAAGRFIDWVGTKKGYAFALTGWSFAAIGHAFGHHALSFGFWRAALGLSEAGNFPAANKTIAEWFPKKERAFATGLYNSGANVGAIVAPLVVPYIARHWGWEWAFILTGAIGLVWIVFWVKMYAPPAAKLKSGHLQQGEYDFIHSDQDEQIAEKADMTHGARISGARLLTFRQTWAFILGKFLTDPIWWFFLFWLPAFLSGENARKTREFMAANPAFTGDPASIPGIIRWDWAVAVIYSVATLGSIFGGWLPKKFINGGMDANKARKLAMFIFALFPLCVLFASKLGAINTWFAVATIAIVCSAHQAWSANIFTTVSDMFPKKAVASVTGLGGMAGAIGGILIAWSAGKLLEHFAALGKTELGYGILFVVCGSAYLVAWVIMHLLVPKFKQIQLNES